MEDAQQAAEEVSNSPHAFEVAEGYTVRSSAASIAFLWMNWDILFNLSKGVFKVDRVTDQSWRGAGFGGRGEWHLIRADYGVNVGRFEFFSWIRFLGTSSRATTVMAYRGRSCGEIPKALWPLQSLVVALGTVAGQRINRIGGKSASAITSNPDLVKDLCDAERYSTLLQMQGEEQALLRNATFNPKYFALNTKRNGVNSAKATRLDRLRVELGALSERATSRIPAWDLLEYERAIGIFEIAPRAAVAHCRWILEQIVARVYEQEFGQDPSERSLFKQIERLYREADEIPRNVTSMMQTIVGLGNIAVHAPSLGRTPSPGRAPSTMDYNEFTTSFDALLGISEWYFVTYLDQIAESAD
jgi:hypothetical protein